jgi:hypothetical protein
MNEPDRESPRHLWLATVSVLLAVTGFVAVVVVQPTALLALMAILCGHFAKAAIRGSGGKWTGLGTATAGCTLGYVLLVLGLLWSAVYDPPYKGRLVTMSGNGRNVYVSLIATDISDPPAWPEWGEDSRSQPDRHAFSNSTDFFRWVVTAGVMNVDYSFFSGPGLFPAVDSLEPAEFTPDHNAWCVVTGVGPDTPDGMPVLFTRNVGVTNLNQFTGPIRKSLAIRDPLKLEGIVCVHVGGSARVLFKNRYRELWEEALPNHAAWYGDRPVLRP